MHRSTLRALMVSLVAGTASDGCSGGCNNPFQPLPAPVPPTQIVEGGIQIRITKSGLAPVTAALETAVNATLGGSGVCIPGQKKIDPGAVLPFIDICYRTNDCSGGEMGCKLNVSVNSASLAPSGPSTLHADVNINGQATVPVHAYYSLFDVGSCDFVARVSNSHIVADVDVGIDGATGEITLHLGHVDVLDVNPDISSPDCGVLADIIDVVSGIAFDLFSTDIGNLIVNLISPTLDGLIQGILPKPLGLDGLLDVGSFLDSIAPGTSAKLEVHGVPGGYATLPAGGISVGVNVGLNADRNPATRGPTNSSEPSLCVPQWTAPDLSAPPASLSRTTRGTFTLPPAGAFLGSPDPPGDVAIGVSQTVLDLAGHHVTSAGTLCLSIGSDLVPQLNLGTIGILVKSLAALGQGKEPIVLALRPTAPINFDIGDGTAASPHLTAHLKDFEIDFYALLFERYIRAFTVGASVDLGINLEFMLDKNGQPVVVPTLVGLDTSKIQVTVTNTELLRETPAQLQAAFPTLLDFVLPLLSTALPDIPVPTIEGFTLGSLSLAHVKSPQDDFLAIYASLATPAPKKLAEPVPRATTTARAVRVMAPPPESIRAALAGDTDGALPEVELALGGTAPDGQAALEWQWSLDGGMWRPFTRDPSFVVRDRALAVEGKHTISVRARAVGDYETTDVDGVAVEVNIDSAPPHIDVSSLVRVGDEIVVTATDAVSDDGALQYALSAPTATGPATAWTANLGHLAIGDVERMAVGGSVRLYVRDEAGNVATSILDVVALFGPSAPLSQTGGCAVGGGADGALGVLIVLALLAARRRRAWILTVLLGACASSKLGPVETPPECTMDIDCSSKCTNGQVGICGTDMTCSCADDIAVGTIGTYANLAVAPTGTAWISAYNTTHGDLMVAQAPASGRVPDSSWEFADGVPSGPVVLPASHVRSGIRAAGDDVGLYTSIALTPAGDPVVAYYDRTHAGLRFAQRMAGKWTSYALDTGVPGSKDIGKYTAISVDAMGRPGIAYLAQITDAPDGSGHSEVRFVLATKAQPASQADWTQLTVESKAMAPPNTMVDDLPHVCGLFIASVRALDGHAIVAYYDRPSGQLKIAEHDPAAGVFKKPVVLDGGGGDDVGWYPSLTVSPDGVVHIAYVDAAHQNLLATTYPGGTPIVVDDGYRIDGTTGGGEPLPVFHHVGDNSAIVDSGTITAIVYQDATTQDLLIATPGAPGQPWTHTKVAGSDMPYKGAYGFYAAAALAGQNLVMSSFALNQMTSEEWVEVFRQKMQ